MNLNSNEVFKEGNVSCLSKPLSSTFAIVFGSGSYVLDRRRADAAMIRPAEQNVQWEDNVQSFRKIGMLLFF